MVMAAEVKKSLGVDRSYGVVGVLLYWHYMKQIYKKEELLVDGFVWHVLKLRVINTDYRFIVSKYCCLLCKDLSVICANIPKLLDLWTAFRKNKKKSLWLSICCVYTYECLVLLHNWCWVIIYCHYFSCIWTLIV